MIGYALYRSGKTADKIALSGDIFTIPPERIRDVRVELTIFDGQVVYERLQH